jgi:hypothetical protein
MPKNTMTDLRNHLFEVMEALKDDENPMELDRARAVCQVAGKLIDSAKVEIDFLKEMDASKATGFFELPAASHEPVALPAPERRRLA